MKAYASGLNRYALENPDQVFVKELFPITEKKMMRYGQLQLFISSKGDQWVSKIINDKLSYNLSKEEQHRGSNTFAFNSSKNQRRVYLFSNKYPSTSRWFRFLGMKLTFVVKKELIY